jgi:hypothetical protein
VEGFAEQSDGQGVDGGEFVADGGGEAVGFG